jgi:NAD(P)-dependent dehydrogenase (short-subunit alcohol dehydrogenase family)
MDLTGKVVIVTGGAKGIGEGCVVKLLEAKATVVVFDLDDQFKNKGLVTSYKVDLTKEAEVKKATDEVVEKFGRIDGLINCAGIQTYGSILDTTEEVWDKTFAVNVKSMFFTSKHAGAVMAKQKSGSIVNISSVQSTNSQKTVVAYASSKGAINTFTRASALDLAEFNVRVNAILPGSVDTPMLRASAEMHKGDKTVDDVLIEWGKGHPLGRIAKPTEIGDLATYLISDHSTFITGSSMVIDGGLTVQVPVVLPEK